MRKATEFYIVVEAGGLYDGDENTIIAADSAKEAAQRSNDENLLGGVDEVDVYLLGIPEQFKAQTEFRPVVEFHCKS